LHWYYFHWSVSWIARFFDNNNQAESREWVVAKLEEGDFNSSWIIMVTKFSGKKFSDILKKSELFWIKIFKNIEQNFKSFRLILEKNTTSFSKTVDYQFGSRFKLKFWQFYSIKEESFDQKFDNFWRKLF
jgi:hypothetical protein